MASMSEQWSALVCTGLLLGCRDAPPPPIHREHAPLTPASTIAIPSSALPSPSASVAGPKSAPPNPQLSCWDWLDPERDAPAAPFPHPVEPGNAMARVLDWAERHKEAKQPGIDLENVHCPRARCVEPDDCWFHVKLNDHASTATSHMVVWMDVHAQTGDLRWQSLLVDGGFGYLTESAKKSRVPVPAASSAAPKK